MANANATDTALETLRALDPARARTFNADDGTVRLMRRVFSRRADGTIPGFHDGTAQCRWEATRVDVCEAARYAVAQVESRKSVALNQVKDAQRQIEIQNGEIARLESEIADARKGLAQAQTMTGAMRDVCANACNAVIADAETKIAAARAYITQCEADIADAQARI